MSEIQGPGKSIPQKASADSPQAPKVKGHSDVQQAVNKAWGAKDFASARSLAKDSREFQKNPEGFCKKLHGFLQQTGQLISKEKPQNKGPLLFTVEKIKEQKEENPYRFAVLAVKGALLLRKSALGKEKNAKGKWLNMQELAISSLPNSMNYVLQTAWATLFEKETSVVIAGIRFLRNSLDALYAALRQKKTLAAVNFSACQIEDELFDEKELENLCQSLRTQSGLLHLCFRHHSLEGALKESLEAFSEQLLSLDLSANSLASTQFLGQNWPKLRELKLAHNQISDKDLDQLLKILENNKNLRQLNLWGNGIGPKAARALVSSQHNLDCLDLGANPIEHETFDDPRVFF